jgi:hypothetical protein
MVLRATLPAMHLFVIGTLVAERLLYVPVLGYSLLVGLLCSFLVGKQRWSQLAVGLVVLCALVVLSARTVARNRDWQSDKVLFERTSKDAPRSIKVCK